MIGYNLIKKSQT